MTKIITFPYQKLKLNEKKKRKGMSANFKELSTMTTKKEATHFSFDMEQAVHSLIIDKRSKPPRRACHDDAVSK